MKCKNDNWLYNITNPTSWSLTPYSSSWYKVFAIYGDGVVGSYSAYSKVGINPVVYLKSNVKITSGDGTSANPYILSL